MIGFFKSGTAPWICRHCQRSGLPSLQKLTDAVSDLKDTTTKRMNHLEENTLKEMKDASVKQYENLEKKINNLEQSIDSKIEKKFEKEKQTMKKEIKDKIEDSLPSLVEKKVDAKLNERLEGDMAEMKTAITNKVTARVERIVDQKLEQMESDGTLDKKIEDIIEKKLATNENNELHKLVESIIDKKMQENPQKAHPSSMVSPRTYMKNTVKNVTTEMREKERRMRNIIVYGLTTSKNSVEKERRREDKKTFQNFVREKLEIEIKDEEIKDCIKLGKNTEEEEKPSPLMITVNEIETKEQIFKNLYKLRGERNITFNHDYTPMEREENKKLTEEAKELSKKDKTGAIYRVRGPPWDRKIIKVVTKEEVVTSKPE